MAGTFLRRCLLNGSTRMGSGTVWPTCNPAATCVSIASLPRLRQIAARPDEERSTSACASAPQDQTNAAHSKILAAANLFAAIRLFTTVNLLTLRGPVTSWLVPL